MRRFQSRLVPHKNITSILRLGGSSANGIRCNSTFTTPPSAVLECISEIEQNVESHFQRTLQPADSLRFFVSTRERCRVPMVMMLGNHSSGKSTLINSLIGDSVQATGVAPTDDGFTVIVRGDKDMIEDGPTAVSNPGYGFEGLRGFGHGMFAHFKVKTKKLDDAKTLLPRNLMLVDTPGMIDTPDTKNSEKADACERGYDFLNVVKWFATRCDVVLLLFDPSNPGTTGETLDVLTHSLKGLEHKFIIVFNKVDMFEKVPDFARCYGALCWNLSKVIDRKDLPRIYTMYTETNNMLPNSKSNVMCTDFKDTRNEVIRDILSAPVRRLDNLITELDSAARHLHMCCTIINLVKSKYRMKAIMTYSGVGTLVIGVPAMIAVGISQLGLVPQVVAAAGFTLAGAVAASTWLLSNLARYMDELVMSMDDIFRVEYHVRLQGDERADVEDCWNVVRSKLQHVLRSNIKTVASLSTTSKSSLRELNDIVTNQVPALRRKAHEIKLKM